MIYITEAIMHIGLGGRGSIERQRAGGMSGNSSSIMHIVIFLLRVLRERLLYITEAIMHIGLGAGGIIERQLADYVWQFFL